MNDYDSKINKLYYFGGKKERERNRKSRYIEEKATKRRLLPALATAETPEKPQAA